MHLVDLEAQRELLHAVEDIERERSLLMAREARVLAEMVTAWGPDHGGLVLEHAGTARIGQNRAGTRQDRAVRLVTLFPVALGLLETGAMRAGTVDILLAVTQHASADVQQRLDARLSERIAVMDAVDVRRLVARVLLEVESEVDEAEQQRRRAQAKADRGVWAYGAGDGMARIGAEVDEIAARRWQLDFAELVRAQKVLDDRDGVTRTKAQREADLFVQLPSLVLGLARGGGQQLALDASAGPDEAVAEVLRLPVSNPTVMHVHVPMTTLLDLDQRTGWVEGLGAVPAMQARMLVATSELRRLAVDSVTGVPLGVDRFAGMMRAPWAAEADLPHAVHRRRRRPRTSPPADPRDLRRRLLDMLGAPLYLDDRAEPQHDPSTGLRELTRRRDQACDGPGCPRTASACELDHEVDWALDGQTALWNLRHRSTRCHQAKHHGWTVAHDPSTGITTWTSPTGRTYDRYVAWDQPVVPARVDLAEPRRLTADELEPQAHWVDLGTGFADGGSETAADERPSRSWSDEPPPF